MNDDSVFRSLVEQSPDAVAVLGWDLRYRYVNPRNAADMGRRPDELVGRTNEELGLPDELCASARAAMLRTLETGEGSELTFSWTPPDGEVRHYHSRFAPHRDAAGEIVAVVAVTRDVTAFKRLEERLRDVAERDPLTGLANRRRFACVEPRSEEVAVCFVDLDGFKDVNDRYGHAVGDAVLTAVASRLERCVRPDDVVARHGGDEFTVLLDGVAGEAEACAVADRIVAALSHPVRVPAGTVRLSASVGVRLSRAPHPPVGFLIEDADLAVYAAKRAGKARISVAR